VPALLHVNHHYGFTVAVSGNQMLAAVARSTVISDHVGSVLMPVFEQVLGWRVPSIRSAMEASGLRLDAWKKERRDTVLLAEVGHAVAVGAPR
jgi:hypothetical protein